MKITLLRTDNMQGRHLSVRSFENLMERIKTGTKEGDVERFRNRLYYYGYNSDDAQRLPVVCPAVNMRLDANGNAVMKEFNGIVTLSVNDLRDDSDVERVKRIAAIMPTTMAAFKGSSGHSVKILVRVCRTDGSLPQTEEEAERFMRAAERVAARSYEGLGLVVNRREKRQTEQTEVSPLMRGFRITHDEMAYFEAKPAFFRIDTNEVEALIPAPMSADDNAAEAAPISDKPTAVGKETRQLLQFMDSRYEFRFNTVMGYTEYRPKGRYTLSWRPVDERVKNRMAIDIRSAGLDIWDKDINRYIMSDKIPEYNPVMEYLWKVRGTWDGKDHIGNLARTVPTDNPHWQKWFRTWFLAMVAQWLGKNRRYGNAVAPLLISRQGYNKSTFCKLLIPRELQWGYNDNLVLSERKSVLQAMSQFLLINLDEFNAISPNLQEGFLKNLIQLASVKVKRPYGKHVEEFPRLASFIATANMSDILSDPSGNRRFIGIELTGPIDISHRIDHPQLFAQAQEMIERDEPYWFDAEQTSLIMQSNERFRRQSPTEMFFYEYFEIAADEKSGTYMSAAAIFNVLREHCGSALKVNSVRGFGRLLSQISQLQSKRTSQGVAYLVRQK